MFSVNQMHVSSLSLCKHILKTGLDYLLSIAISEKKNLLSDLVVKIQVVDWIRHNHDAGRQDPFTDLRGMLLGLLVVVPTLGRLIYSRVLHPELASETKLVILTTKSQYSSWCFLKMHHVKLCSPF